MTPHLEHVVAASWIPGPRDVVAERDAALVEILPPSLAADAQMPGSRLRRGPGFSGVGSTSKFWTLICASFSQRSPAYFQLPTPV